MLALEWKTYSNKLSNVGERNAFFFPFEKYQSSKANKNYILLRSKSAVPPHTEYSMKMVSFGNCKLFAMKFSAFQFQELDRIQILGVNHQIHFVMSLSRVN